MPMRSSIFLAAVLSLVWLGSARGAKRDAPRAEVVNINTAEASQLQLLPRVGPALARRIIDARTKRRFRTTYQLLRVRGIGGKTYRRLRPHIVIEGPTTLTRKIK